MPVKQLEQDMTTGNGFVQNPEELGSDVSPHPRVPRRIEPVDTPPPAPALPLPRLLI